MRNGFAPGSAVVVIFAAIFPAILITSNAEYKLEKRLSGAWKVDNKASYEYQKTGETYFPNIVKLSQNISICFDIKEKTCLIQSTLGNELAKYNILSKENEKIALTIGDKSFIFGFMDNDKALLCLSNIKDTDCLVLTKGETSCSQ